LLPLAASAESEMVRAKGGTSWLVSRRCRRGHGANTGHGGGCLAYLHVPCSLLPISHVLNWPARGPLPWTPRRLRELRPRHRCHASPTRSTPVAGNDYPHGDRVRPPTCRVGVGTKAAVPSAGMAGVVRPLHDEVCTACQ
jgi:hypothetical protein